MKDADVIPLHRTAEATLADRAPKYGSFEPNAMVAQDIKAAMRRSPKWTKLRADQKESLELMATKMARMLSGDPDYIDNWHDIAGYAKLVEDRLVAEQTPRESA